MAKSKFIVETIKFIPITKLVPEKWGGCCGRWGERIALRQSLLQNAE